MTVINARLSFSFLGFLFQIVADELTGFTNVSNKLWDIQVGIKAERIQLPRGWQLAKGSAKLVDKLQCHGSTAEGGIKGIEIS